jgi:transposase InsO family protein
MLERIKTIAEKTVHSYGSRRMTKQLQDEGYAVGRFKVRRLMQEAGVAVQERRRSRPKTTDSRHGYGVAP